MNPEPTRPREWSVNIPFADLYQLINHLESTDSLRRENVQLRRELDGLRTMFSELMDQFGELRRDLKGR